MVEESVDILIIGGGLTGATLMLALNDFGYRTLLIEATPFSERVEEHFDARTIALAPASHHILEMLNLWPLLQNNATPIEKIHISEQGYFGRAKLHSSAHYPLGYVVEMRAINQALSQRLNHQHILAPATVTAVDRDLGRVTISKAEGELLVKAKLIVAADG
ncbi:MAG: 2-octaprenyl-6-methoxyphenyl hydroxylase, partial [Gammaproteobacteria bacterium]|nr:2-octaprenyl-6-methoxyphenyl hydroxylase [Gammaproteobacteria bacterium]